MDSFPLRIAGAGRADASSYPAGSPLGERADAEGQAEGFADDLGSGGGPKKRIPAGAPSVAQFSDASSVTSPWAKQWVGLRLRPRLLGREHPSGRMEGSSGKRPRSACSCRGPVSGPGRSGRADEPAHDGRRRFGKQAVGYPSCAGSVRRTDHSVSGKGTAPNP